MGCACKNKNKEFHPCQNGGQCQCGGKCKKQNNEVENGAGQYNEHNFNAVGSLDEFKTEEKNVGKLILYTLGGLTLAGVGYYLYKKIKR
jgi:hypothetical protein|tara:strand:- start:46 stop:312 length:267 start_codon:yes stop_codon:yes gene_type:complete